ncbi:MAG: hypothetical protein AABN95_19615 [Acidobacteriota bacterium]
MNSRSIIILAAILTFSGTFSVAFGQTVGGKGTVREKPNVPTTPTRRTNATIKAVKSAKPVNASVRTVFVTPTTGSLSVGAEPHATILVEPINLKRVQAQKGTLPAGERVFVFRDLKPGRYRVAGTLAGHQEVETEVMIAANNSQSATLNFRPILYSVIINTNVSTGELKYAPKGQMLSNFIPIQNKIVRLDLPAGDYDIELKAAEFGYEMLRKTFSLTEDNTVLQMPLERSALTTETLSPTWTSADLQTWEMPDGWRPDSKKNLTVKGTGVALPRDEGFRHYKDFKLSSSARMLNAVALSFALRARDSKNYYLLQLTGEKSDEPNNVRLFLVKNGVEQRIRAIPIPRAGAKSMDAGQFFTVLVEMVDFTIKVEIVDTETGAPYPLGALTDPARTFAVGAVGIAGHANEENVIGRFVVCTGDKC